jgi:hypothetical protein
MTPKQKKLNEIVERFKIKSVLKQQIYQNTLHVFSELKQVAIDFVTDTKKELIKNKITQINVEFNDKSEFEAELRFASDALVFLMHTNVFQFPREHSIMRTSYIKEDESRAYCGVIYVYNFLADSLKYKRENDIGYLVARIFINKDLHFVVEGKRQIHFLNNTFVPEPIDYPILKKILDTAIVYCIDFDLLLQPYEMLKEVTLSQLMEYSSAMHLQTGKRLGFRFQADPGEML